ncbi:MAG: beta-galactosidase [Gemmiger sp.]|nr:beta-galactosidase [Gemmiger sp.]
MRVQTNRLFSKPAGLLHGGDYNPEQWLDRPDILEEDIRLMKQAHVNEATLGVFAWSVEEPSEGVFHFDWLKEIMDRLYENGIYTILATPTGARPVWLDKKYPEAMRVNSAGERNLHGLRHNHCMSAPAFRARVKMIDTQLAQALGNHPGLLMWHISNELGGECYCPLCRARFQQYLRGRFGGDISALNHAWWTTFWSHQFSDFDEIDPPMKNGEGSIGGLNLAWKEFTSWNMTDFLKTEIDTLRAVTPHIPVTTNFMKLYNGLDYRVLHRPLDVVSWDSYPRFGNNEEPLADTFAENAFDHAVMRSFKKDRPFLLMESAPGLVNWHPYNALKRPGIHSLAGLQAVACGADSVLYFQWRKGRGSFEQYHGAVVDHLGTGDTRVFKEVEAMGSQLQALAPVAGSLSHNRVALLFDWPNRWAIADMAGLSREKKQYERTCLLQHRSLLRMGVDCDILSMQDDLTPYKLVVAPMLYLLELGASENLTRYVQQGGNLVAGYLAGYVNEDTLCWLGGFPGDGLSDLFGVISEEIDTLYPGKTNAAIFEGGTRFAIQDFAELLRLKGAQVLAKYEQDYCQNTPAVTVHTVGTGNAYYVAARLEQAGMEHLYRRCLAEAGIPVQSLPHGVEFHCRYTEKERFAFYLNESENPATIADVFGTDMLTGQVLDGTLRLAPLQAAVLRQAR